MSKVYSVRPVGWATVSDPATTFIGFKLEPVWRSDDANSIEDANCPVCKVNISYDPSTVQNTIEEVACCLKHAQELEGLSDWTNVQPPPEKIRYKSDKPKFCPGCGGERRGRGYSHKDDDCKHKEISIENNSDNEIEQNNETININKNQINSATESFNRISKNLDVCPECKGPAKGRGYTHLDNCSLSTKAKLAATIAAKIVSGETCPSCKGLKAGRGFSHTNECPESTKFKLNIQKKLRNDAINTIGEKPSNCPECKGIKKGRGYTHSDNCSLRTGIIPVR